MDETKKPSDIYGHPSLSVSVLPLVGTPSFLRGCSRVLLQKAKPAQRSMVAVQQKLDVVPLQVE